MNLLLFHIWNGLTPDSSHKFLVKFCSTTIYFQKQEPKDIGNATLTAMMHDIVTAFRYYIIKICYKEFKVYLIKDRTDIFNQQVQGKTYDAYFLSNAFISDKW